MFLYAPQVQDDLVRAPVQTGKPGLSERASFAAPDRCHGDGAQSDSTRELDHVESRCGLKHMAGVLPAGPGHATGPQQG